MKWNVEKVGIVPHMRPIGQLVDITGGADATLVPLPGYGATVRVWATVEVTVNGNEDAMLLMLERGKAACLREMFRDAADLVEEAVYMLDHDPIGARERLSEALRVMHH